MNSTDKMIENVTQGEGAYTLNGKQMTKSFIEETLARFDEKFGKNAPTELIFRSRSSFQDFNAEASIKSFLSDTLTRVVKEIEGVDECTWGDGCLNKKSIITKFTKEK